MRRYPRQLDWPGGRDNRSTRRRADRGRGRRARRRGAHERVQARLQPQRLEHRAGERLHALQRHRRSPASSSCFLVGRWQDALFGFAAFANAIIGCVQEFRAKAALDRLALLNAPRARVLRDGGEHEIAAGRRRDRRLLVLRAGDQVPADAGCRTRAGCRSTSRCSRASPTPSTSTPGTRRCRARSSSRGEGDRAGDPRRRRLVRQPLRGRGEAVLARHERAAHRRSTAC